MLNVQSSVLSSSSGIRMLNIIDVEAFSPDLSISFPSVAALELNLNIYNTSYISISHKINARHGSRELIKMQ